MSRIKFRGKGIETGEWVCGDLLHVGNGCIIATDSTLGEPLPDGDTALSYGKDEIAVVNPDTVGQFTGLLDKNGIEICEGDVLAYTKYEWTKMLLVEYKFGAFGYTYIDEFQALSGNSNFLFGTLGADANFEIVGNIHDNPELLKGGNDE